ncbi:siderophore-interacting protein [Rhodococcoides yunnanense]|uniref:siderophore-interacting protein n=1 Tax=Rhodococcoides yunnanense TaxID=278209 RepID=UPI000932E0A8|nr:siderophore-interacting protein [Rhodococcus yunnanensis]
MTVPELDPQSSDATMRTLAISRPRPGVFSMTSVLARDPREGDWNGSNWDEQTISTWLRFPGVSPDDYTVRRFDSGRGIVDIDFRPGPQNTIMQRWLESVKVGSRHRISKPGNHLPNFRSGCRTMLFADEVSLPAVRSILQQWPTSVDGATISGTVWIDTPNPADVADLPVIDEVSIVSFHIGMGFDPLVTAARRCDLSSRTTVWAAGERRRMDAIRAACDAAGLSDDDARVFGYWSNDRSRRRS